MSEAASALSPNSHRKARRVCLWLTPVLLLAGCSGAADEKSMSEQLAAAEAAADRAIKAQQAAERAAAAAGAAANQAAPVAEEAEPSFEDGEELSGDGNLQPESIPLSAPQPPAAPEA